MLQPEMARQPHDQPRPIGDQHQRGKQQDIERAKAPDRGLDTHPRHARPYDLWLHARGVSGSHVVIRVKGRANVPPGPVVERAARLAAFHSKAKTSALVPVVVTPRKWVRKAKGSPPGQVVVEREAEVRIVPPEAP